MAMCRLEARPGSWGCAPVLPQPSMSHIKCHPLPRDTQLAGLGGSDPRGLSCPRETLQEKKWVKPPLLATHSHGQCDGYNLPFSFSSWCGECPGLGRGLRWGPWCFPPAQVSVCRCGAGTVCPCCSELWAEPSPSFLCRAQHIIITGKCDLCCLASFPTAHFLVNLSLFVEFVSWLLFFLPQQVPL